MINKTTENRKIYLLKKETYPTEKFKKIYFTIPDEVVLRHSIGLQQKVMKFIHLRKVASVLYNGPTSMEAGN